jgi:hydrogenase maturation protein HypF
VAKRFARLRQFRLPGGEAAVRDPRRVALALVYELGEAQLYWVLARRFGFSDGEAVNLRAMLAGGINSPLCSSVGRLFDAVGALLGLGTVNSFEGQMPLAVEASAWRARAGSDELRFELKPAVEGGAVWSIDWALLVLALVRHTADAAAQAAAFHRGLARMIADVARAAGVGTVALSGGCFQNALLHDLAGEALRTAGHRVLTHRELSPNDGSIAAGQALGALWNLTTVVLP